MKKRAIICPGCRLLISAGEPRCPHCGLSSPGAAWRRAFMFRLLADPGLVVRAVVGVNIAMFALSLFLDPRAADLTLNPLQLLAPSDRSLFVLGATGTIPVAGFGRWWTLLSANYLHGSILHIFFNMAAFRQLAGLVEREYGAGRMFLVYTLSGVAGFALSFAAGVPLTIGASAGVCGLVGATLYFARSRGGVYGAALYRQIGMWTLIMFVFGFIVPGINNWGHGGGIAAGALLGALMGYRDRRKETSFQRSLAAVCLVATLIVLLWAVATAVFFRFVQ